MDTVIFTGTIPLEEFKVDRPAEYETLVKRGELEAHLEPAPDARQVRGWRIFGAIGILLILLIVFAAVFSYR